MDYRRRKIHLWSHHEHSGPTQSHPRQVSQQVHDSQNFVSERGKQQILHERARTTDTLLPVGLEGSQASSWQQLLNAGINDWGGLSPLTRDFVNPEKPWPHLKALANATAATGKNLVPRCETCIQSSTVVFPFQS